MAKERNKTPNTYNFLTWKKSEENLVLTTCLHVSYLTQFWWFCLLFIPLSPVLSLLQWFARVFFITATAMFSQVHPRGCWCQRWEELCFLRRIGCWWNLWARNESAVLCPKELLWLLSFTRMCLKTKSFSIVSNPFSYKQLKYPGSIVQGIQGHGLG